MENVIAFVINIVVLGIISWLIWTNDENYDETSKSVDEDPTECWSHDN